MTDPPPAGPAAPPGRTREEVGRHCDLLDQSWALLRQAVEDGEGLTSDEAVALLVALDAARARIAALESEPVLRRGDEVTVHGVGGVGSEVHGRVAAFGNLAGPLVVTIGSFRIVSV